MTRSKQADTEKIHKKHENDEAREKQNSVRRELTRESSSSFFSYGLYSVEGRETDENTPCELSSIRDKRLVIDKPRSQIACEFWNSKKILI